jgi:hypothetical protein
MADKLPPVGRAGWWAAKDLLARLADENVLADDLGLLRWQLLEFRDAWYVACHGRVTRRVWTTYCRVDQPTPAGVRSAWAQALALHWWEMSWT